MPDLDILRGLVARFDFFYQFSDDHGVWTRGSNQRDAINAEIAKLVGQGVSSEIINDVWNEFAPDECKRGIS